MGMQGEQKTEPDFSYKINREAARPPAKKIKLLDNEPLGTGPGFANKSNREHAWF